MTILPSITTALSTPEARALNRRMSHQAWAVDQEERAAKVALFRQYAEGEHRAELTPEMRRMLRVGVRSSDARSLVSRGRVQDVEHAHETRFNDNYMDIVIQTMADRLRVKTIETDSDGADEWLAGVMEANRFDALQNDVHEAAIRDGDTYVMASWDNNARQIVLTSEPAYDGANGVLVVTAPDNTVQAAIKVWQESRESRGDTSRINVYYADRVEKYIGRDGGGLERYQAEGEPWPAPWLWNGEPIGVPIIHFPNRGTAYDFYGLSEIENAVPLQDALNRTLYSMVMTAELTGFGVRWAKGFAPPAGVMPGTWIAISPNGLDKEQVAELGMMEQGAITPYIEQAQWLTAEIGKITRTPAPEFMGADTASGEALKQREIGLLGKVRKFQVKVGNRWEDVARLAWRVQAAFGDAPPAFETANTLWDEAELRNDAEVIANAKVLVEMGLVKEGLRQMASVFSWTPDKVEELFVEHQQAQIGLLSSMIGNTNFPTFDAALAGVRL